MVELVAAGDVRDPLAEEPGAGWRRTPVGNLLAWSGGADRRDIADRPELSAYQTSGFFVVLNAVIAWLVMTLAVTGITDRSVLSVVPYTVVWGLFVGAFDRAVSAVVVDAEPGRAGRRRAGYLVRAVFTVVLGVMVAETASLAVFHDSIERTMRDNIQRQLSASRTLVDGTAAAPSPRTREKVAKQREVRALGADLKRAQINYTAKAAAWRCARTPTAGCPPAPGGTEIARLQRERLAAGAAVAAAKAKFTAQAPALNQRIVELQASIETDLRSADDLAAKESGVDARWRAMQDYTTSSASALTMRIGLAVLLVFLDFIPLLLKLLRGQTGHDQRVLSRRRRTAGALQQGDAVWAAEIQEEAEAAAEARVHRRALERERWDTDLRVEKVRQQQRYDQVVAQVAAPSAAPAPGRPNQRPGPRTTELEPGPVARSAGSVPSWWSDDDRALIGKRFGNYRATGALPGADRGSFGRMLVGYDVSNQSEIVVIKAVDPGDRGREQLTTNAPRRMWEVEISTAQELAAHTAIAKVLDHGYDHGHLWIASPRYVPGSLVSWVAAQDGRLTLSLTFLVMQKVTDALRYAHERNFTHGDLKPQNVAMNGSRPTLLDWGLARAVRDVGADQTLHRPPGTMYYTAPEAFLSVVSWDKAYADLYSVGATWYYLLTGRPPFRSEAEQLGLDVVGLAAEVHAGRLLPTPLLDLLPDLPAGVAGLVHQLLSGSPSERCPGSRPDTAAADLLVAIGELESRLTPRDVLLPVGAEAVAAAGPVTEVAPAPSGRARGRREPPVYGTRGDGPSLTNVLRLPTAAPNGTLPMPVEDV